MRIPQTFVGDWLLETQLQLPSPIDEVFSFFSNAHNLSEITPPFVKFSVLNTAPIQMHEGALIDYRLKIHGIPIRWRTEIVTWEPKHRFVDIQLRGPYRRWHHEHLFEPNEHGTLCIDRVTYGVPGGWLIQKLFVGKDVERIFKFRHHRLLEIFEGPTQT